jgi:ribosomal 30S subunit maturation factor RimM
MLYLNERFKQTKRRFKNRVKLQKFKEFKTKNHVLKRKNNEIVEELTKKLKLKKIEFFLNNLM